MSTALQILGVGAVTAVGLSAPQTCAALRARVSGFGEMALLPPPAEPVLCAAVPARARLKQTRSGWLVHLAARAVKECVDGHDLRKSRLALLVALPDAYRKHPALERVGGRGILYGIQLRLGVPLANGSEAIEGGHAATLQCLLKARELIERDAADLCIVGGVDSLLNRQDVEGLAAAARLHDETNPQGVVPGEAAAFMLVSDAAKRPSGALAQILGIGQANEQNAIRGERFATGDGLRAALDAAIGDAGRAEAELALRVSDMNGERYRAWDSMIGSTRFYRTRREHMPAWYPAASVGDTGAAAAALAVVAATVGIMRGYAPGALAMCEASSDDGLRAACVVAPAPGGRSPPFRGEAPRGEASAEEMRWLDQSGAASKTAAIPAIVDQHVEEAPFLWAQRDIAALRPDMSIADLSGIHDRLDAALDGLRTAGPAARRLCSAALADESGGAFFAATWLALKDRDGAGLQSLLDAAKPASAPCKEIVAAFAWVPRADLAGVVKRLLDSSSPLRRFVGIAACAAHRLPPGPALAAAVADADPRLRALALRSLGQSGLRSELAHCRQAYGDEHAACRFWAAHSGFLLGDTEGAGAVLTAACLVPGPERDAAIGLLLRALPVAEAHGLVSRLRAAPDGQRLLVRGAGMIGDPSYVPWLLAQMREPTTARLAGEAFGAITGLDLAQAGMTRKAPEGAPGGPSDDPADDKVEIDLDIYLPWPDADKLQQWWQANGAPFRAGVRYFGGEPLSVEGCRRVLDAGYQRQRAAAALHISLARPGTPLFATAAPAWRQRSAPPPATETR